MNNLIERVSTWLRERQDKFLAKLEEMGNREYTPYDESGNQVFYMRAADGKYSGAGLCGIASAALGEALPESLGDDISIQIITREMGNTKLCHTFLHVNDGTETVSIDSTFRQHRRTAPRTIAVFPSVNDEKFYRGGRESEREDIFQKIANSREIIQKGGFKKITLPDYEELVKTLTD